LNSGYSHGYSGFGVFGSRNFRRRLGGLHRSFFERINTAINTAFEIIDKPIRIIELELFTNRLNLRAGNRINITEHLLNGGEKLVTVNELRHFGHFLASSSVWTYYRT
jgi:hypothetical protein